MRQQFVGVILVLSLNGSEPSKRPSDPRILSVHPAVIESGATSRVTVRGTSLAGSRGLVFSGEELQARLIELRSEPAPQGPPVDLVSFEISGRAREGSHPFRLISDLGVSNELPLHVVQNASVVDEASLESPVTRFPAVITGKIAEKGEVDTIWIQAGAKEILTLECQGGTSFDPSLQIAEPSGSWFDQSRLNRIAFNDEPLHFPGLPTDARIVHRFERAGKYAIQVGSSSGQGGPDATWVLRISPGAGDSPVLHPPQKTSVWEERQFTRKLPADWLTMLAVRGGPAPEKSAMPVFHAVADGAAEVPVMTAPGVVEGRISKPAGIHRIRVRVEAAQDLAIEVETPEATMPRFNPVVRLMAPDSGEVVTNVYTKRNNNGLYMMKMIQAKSTFTLRSAGDYLLEIRDITTDVAGDDFAYRILLRPQIPHIGKVQIVEDHVNLEPGQAKPLTVHLDREEGFTGLVLLSADGLPEGVTATAGMANPIEKPPLPNGGRLERYTGKTQTATLILSAAKDAKASDKPFKVRVHLQTVSADAQNAPILIREIPVMVISRRPS